MLWSQIIDGHRTVSIFNRTILRRPYGARPAAGTPFDKGFYA